MGNRKLQKYGWKMSFQWVGATILFACAMLIFAYWEGLVGFYKQGALMEGLSFLLPLDLYICTLLIVPIMAATMCKTYFPIYVSMGCTRKKSFFYIMEIQLGVMMLVMILVNILWRISGKNLGPELKYMPVFIAVLIAIGAAGIFMGGIMIRFGGVAVVVFIIACVVLGVTTGMIVSFSGDSRFITFLQSGKDIFKILPDVSVGFIALGGSILLYVTGSVIAWKIMKRVEVRV